jgi:sorbitol-specific phosphotransferase system component IIA
MMRFWCATTLRSCVAATCLAYAALCRAQGAPIESATTEQLRVAQEAFREGDQLFDMQQYEQAIQRYRASYSIVASPNTALMIARALRELGRLDEAYAQYEAAVEEAERAVAHKPDYQQTAQAAQAELQALRSRVGLVNIDLGDVPPTADVTVAGKEVDPAVLDEPVIVTPGEVVVQARTADGQEARVVVNAPAGREVGVTLQLGEVAAEASPAVTQPRPAVRKRAVPAEPEVERPATAGSPLKLYAYVAGGVGVAGLAAFTVFGLMNNANYEDLDEACPDGHCPPGRADDIDTGRRYQMLANVSALVGAVGLGASVTLYYLGHRQESARQASVTVGPASIHLSGRF